MTLDIAVDGELAAALLARAESGLIALTGRGRVAMANPAALDVLHLCGPLEGLAFAGLLAGSEAPVQRWLDDGALRPLAVQRPDGRALLIEAVPGPGGHLLLTARLGGAGVVPAGWQDELTGLANRAWFMDRLGAAGHAAVLLIDLEHFKSINQRLGHALGDTLLQIVAKRLCSALRDADVIGRLSGDVFGVLMALPPDPEAVGKRVRAVLTRPCVVDGIMVSLGASIGIALAPEQGRDPAMLLHAAESALAAAKRDPFVGVQRYSAETDESSGRLCLSDALRRAVALRQFELHFQPHLVLASGALSGFEALLRWQHPELGLLKPDEFIPLAEASGLIWPIGEWVLRTACEEAITWPGSLSVSVNISSRQLIDPHRLPRLIKSALLRSGLAPHRLEVEVKESILTENEDAVHVLAAIHDLGVRISLDDFGRGAAAINHLQRLKLHALKVDRSFVQALGRDDAAAETVRAIASLGRTLGITTVAKGVETAEQQDRARLEGCTEVQGYVVSGPVPAREIGHVISSLQRSPDRAQGWVGGVG